MLDTDTKRRIDTARDILVGKVPDPKSQVEQITIALIYKFMDDMDAEAEELGGRRKFFAGGYARYGWAKLMRAGLGGHEVLNLYAEAISKMPENPGIPPLFRNIFRNAYLPYRDPETLKSFLKIIDEFNYDHSERLGDAFEYLLSVLGSQGDAGQFRTPRHIIDFIVDIVDPKKNETILDPACGTAGFLISSYKHILRANMDKKGHVRLTPDERGRLAKNLKGYDISPDMVRLSLVNLYLHGFTDPHIDEYDTLTSEERWKETADVILANPPFMSPKGGIKPHRRFSVQSKRSEVLFVDYIAEHLSPTGRAGIIVPEGIIFQSQGAYVELRKMLVENHLVAIISLPAGVFNPYSGVKTSVLILDRSLARQSDTIGFFKVENDGFGLGAQRRSIEKDDMPQVKSELGAYFAALRGCQPTSEMRATCGLIVTKDRIAANGDYNLSGERYRAAKAALTTFEFRTVGEIALEIKAGFASGHSSVDTDGVPHIRPMNITDTGAFTLKGLKRIPESEFAGRDEFELRKGDVLFNNTNSKELVGKTCLIPEDIRGGFSNHMTRIRVKQEACLPGFLALVLHDAWRKGQFLQLANRWIGQAGVNATVLSGFQIPLPPTELQREIVAEIEGYQKVIDGARAVLDNYRPHITINPEWPLVRLEDVCTSIADGDHQPPPKAQHGIPFVTISNINDNHQLDFTKTFFVSESYYRKLTSSRKPREGDILYTVTGSYGIPVFVETDVSFCFQRHIALLRTGPQLLNSFFYSLLLSPYMLAQGDAAATGVAQKTVSLKSLRDFTIPLPPIAVQQEIVTEIRVERALVDANRELITRFEKKIQTTLARVWGESEVNLEIDADLMSVGE